MLLVFKLLHDFGTTDSYALVSNIRLSYLWSLQVSHGKEKPIIFVGSKAWPDVLKSEIYRLYHLFGGLTDSDLPCYWLIEVLLVTSKNQASPYLTLCLSSDNRERHLRALYDFAFFLILPGKCSIATWS